MRIFESESDLLATIDRLDSLIRECANGTLSYEEFEADYGYPYGDYALDGHESDEQEQALLAQHERRLALHRRVRDEILHLACSAANAELESYQTAGFFGPGEAQRRLRALVDEYFPREAPR